LAPDIKDILQNRIICSIWTET